LNGRELRIARLAAKQLERLPKARFDQITARLQELDANQPNLDIKPLRGHAPWQRLRVGEYRIVFRRDRDGILVAAVVPRQALDAAVAKLAG
jgi:mRNA-degrading endonuclease RelE of RelBE toxin-antitoxin system